MVKLAPRGHVVMRMHQGYTVPDSAKKVLTAADFGITTQSPPTGGVEASASAVVAVSTPSASGGDGANASGDVAAAPASAGVNLFADSYVPSFFRC